MRKRIKRPSIPSHSRQEFHKSIDSTEPSSIIRAFSPKREPILCSLPLHPLVMSRYPSRSLVSIVATGSDNQRRFCLNVEVCLLAFPHAIPPSSPFYRQLYPTLCLEYFPGPISALSRLVSPCLRPHVCASANYPSPFNTTSLSLPFFLRLTPSVSRVYARKSSSLPLILVGSSPSG